MQKSTLKLVRAGMIGALYVLFSLITLPISGGVIQFRLSEGLNILPLLFPEAVPALFVGCLLFNYLSGLALYDVLFGSLITLVSAVCVWGVGRFINNTAIKLSVAGLFPVLLNAFGLPLIWLYLCDGLVYTYMLQVAFLLISQSVSVYLFGFFFYHYPAKLRAKGIRYFS